MHVDTRALQSESKVGKNISVRADRHVDAVDALTPPAPGQPTHTHLGLVQIPV